MRTNPGLVCLPLLMGLLVFAASARAQDNLTQTHYRWRNDDGGEGSAPISIDRSVSASSDDAEEPASVWNANTTSSDLELTEDGATNQQVGMRFLNITVPPGATITNAYVQFTTDASWSVPTTLTFYGQAIDNAPTFTTAVGDITGRTKTAAFVNWVNVPAWSVPDAGPNQRTPDLSSIVQEIVNRPGWSSGNALVVLVTGSGVREAESFDGSVPGAPRLHVEYTTPGASWAENEDTKLFGLAKSTIRRARFLISNTGAGSSGAVTYRLQAAETATCGSGTYTDVPAAAGGHWQVIDSTFITDAQATVNISPGLTDPFSSTFVAGQLKDAGNTTSGITLNANQFTEIEFSIQATALATDGGDYCFRLVDGGSGLPLDTYSVYAEARLAGPGGGTLTLVDHSVGQLGDRFTSASPITDVLFRFRLAPSVVITVDTLRVNFTTAGGVANADVSSGELWYDANGDGAVNAGDTLIQGDVTPSGGVLTFTQNFSPALITGSDYLVRATVANLAAGDTTTFFVGAPDIDEVEAGVFESGLINPVTHTEDACSPQINYRSIGTYTGNLASAGTATVSSGSPTVTFDGVSLLGSIHLGDMLTLNPGPTEEILFILSLNSTTQVTVQTNALASHTDVPYTIKRAFNTLQGWEDAQDGDLVGQNRREVGVAYKDGTFTAGAVIDGSTTDSCHFMQLTVGEGHRHNGTAGTGVVLDGQDTDQGIRVQDDYTVLEGFEFKRIRGPSASGASSVVAQLSSNVLLQNLLIYDFADGANIATGVRGQTNAGYTVRNSIIFNGDRAGIRNNDVTATGIVENCTIYRMNDGGGGFGVLNTAGTLTVRNTVAVSNDVDFSGGVMTQSSNLSSDGTAVCATCLPNRTPTANASPPPGPSYVVFQNITPGSEDLHLQWSSENDALDAATDLSASFSNDIDGETRSAPWDIGADEHGRVNHRSIGSYSTGTATVPLAGTTVDFGGGASLPTWVQAGDSLTIYPSAGNPESFTIASVVSPTQVTVTAASAANHAGEPYVIGWVYSTGQAAVAQGSRTVNFSNGASLPARVGLGDKLTLAPGGANQEVLHVLSRNSATQVTVQTPATLNHSTPENYRLERAYRRLQDWESDRDGNLAADKRREVGVAYNDGPFTTGIRFQDSTTDAGYFMHLTVAISDRHTGKAGTGVVLDGGLDAVTASTRNIDIGDDYTVVDWFELKRHIIDCVELSSTNVLLRYLIIHDFGAGDFWDGIAVANDGIENRFTVQNCIIYNGTDAGIGGGGPEDIGTIENCTIYGMAVDGISDDGSVFTVRNTIAVNTGSPRDINFTNPSSAQQNNLISKATPTCPTCLVSRVATDNASPPPGPDYVVFQNLTPGSEDFHLKSSPENDAVNMGANLSASFSTDIDGGVRPAGPAWDIGADELGSTTAVKLVSFTATGLNGEALLVWETGSEMNNLGFNLYRARSREGPYEGITASVIPGLGTSPEGAVYRYLDTGLVNGVTYFYKLEDVETTGKTKLHGPVSATPQSGAGSPEFEGNPSQGEPQGSSLITYGNPSANRFTVVRASDTEAVLELITEGFYAEPLEDGTVELSVPGFEPVAEPARPSIPVKRPWVAAVAGVGVKLVSVEEGPVVSFTGLTPSAGQREVVGSREGTFRLRVRPSPRGPSGQGPEVGLLYPRVAARILGTGFQGDVKKVQVELAPLRWDGRAGQLFLARRLLVKLSFEGKARGERSLGGSRGRRYAQRASHRERSVLARLVTREPGLHVVRYEELLRRGRSLSSSALRLSRLGQLVPYHLEPSSTVFGPGSRLYFVSAGPEANPYGHEAVYELGLGRDGARMAVAEASPRGESTTYYWERISKEVNRYYQAGLVEAPDLWLWDLLMAPVKKSYAFQVRNLAPSPEAPRLSVWLQGASNFEADPDHHVRVYVNGSLLKEVSWEGKTAQQVELEILPGALLEGANLLELENVGDTGARYSMVFLDRFELAYPRALEAEGGRLAGSWTESGVAVVAGVSGGGYVVDVTDEPVWLKGAESSQEGALRFGVEAGRDYLVVGENGLGRPELQWPSLSGLKSQQNEADYLVVGPQAFLDEAGPLIELRRGQGLRVKAVSFEQVVEEFGWGEARPEAIGEFFTYAYHRWKAPALRYVLLLGDGTYDYKNYLGTGVENRVPPLLVKTSYLWTASDPTQAATNGDDLLPDLAIGRLPAATEAEARVMVEKILAYETGVADLSSQLVLVADNSDAGEFAGNAEAIAAGVLSGRPVRKLYLGALGSARLRGEIVEAFDEGASLMSYIGHGGIHLWADENIFNTAAVGSLAPQPQQPLFVTMNCLNGYFHFPYFNSLAEAVLKAEGRGAIASFSPSGLSLNEPAHVLHQALLDEVFNRGHARLGDAVLAAQKAYAASGIFPELLAIYHLLGDPALSLR